MGAEPDPGGVEIEFREVPYCIVSRSRENWGGERGDINALRLLSAGSAGLVVDPDSRPVEGQNNQGHRHTLIPWTNVISLTVARGSGGPVA